MGWETINQEGCMHLAPHVRMDNCYISNSESPVNGGSL